MNAYSQNGGEVLARLRRPGGWLQMYLLAEHKDTRLLQMTALMRDVPPCY